MVLWVFRGQCRPILEVIEDGRCTFGPDPPANTPGIAHAARGRIATTGRRPDGLDYPRSLRVAVSCTHTAQAQIMDGYSTAVRNARRLREFVRSRGESLAASGRDQPEVTSERAGVNSDSQFFGRTDSPPRARWPAIGPHLAFSVTSHAWPPFRSTVTGSVSSASEPRFGRPRRT
jgi:hypothetical protein